MGEEQLVVQFPWVGSQNLEVVEKVKRAIASGDGCDVSVLLDDATPTRRMRLTIEGVGSWDGTLTNLPCIVESHKCETKDSKKHHDRKKGLYKSCTISQMLILDTPPPPLVSSSSSSVVSSPSPLVATRNQVVVKRKPRSTTAIVSSTHASTSSLETSDLSLHASSLENVDTKIPLHYPDGLTPPTHGIRARQFELLPVPPPADIMGTLRLLDAISNQCTVEECKLGYVVEEVEISDDDEEEEHAEEKEKEINERKVEKKRNIVSPSATFHHTAKHTAQPPSLRSPTPVRKVSVAPSQLSSSSASLQSVQIQPLPQLDSVLSTHTLPPTAVSTPIPDNPLVLRIQGLEKKVASNTPNLANLNKIIRSRAVAEIQRLNMELDKLRRQLASSSSSSSSISS